MSGNSEKMVIISSTANEWPQTQIDDQKGLMASTGRIMEKQTQTQTQDQQQQQQPLMCPRCDSSNTKFCYYNNYSLSQPRHFCKACKRYWTRGGTLRNVPVGGGCRKNKRVKRPAAAGSPSIDASTSGPHTATVNSSAHQPQIDLSSASSNHMSSLFYGLPTNHSDPSLPFSTVTGYDLQSGMSGLGLGFSGGLMVNEFQDDDYRNGFNPIKQIQDLSATSNSFFPDLGSSSSTCTTTPTLASLLASGLQKNGFKDIQGFNNFHGFSPYEDQFQMPVNSSGSVVSKELKMMESGQNKADWNNNVPRQISQVQLMGPSSDPSLFWNINNNASNVWLDPASIGFSVPSLI